jgi:hypothetical protein
MLVDDDAQRTGALLGKVLSGPLHKSASSTGSAQ